MKRQIIATLAVSVAGASLSRISAGDRQAESSCALALAISGAAAGSSVGAAFSRLRRWSPASEPSGLAPDLSLIHI